jgi:hypothetical protein
MVAVTTGVMLACTIFYLVSQSARRTDVLINLLFNNPWSYFLVCLIPAILSALFVVFFRRRNYIVGFKLDEDYIYLQVRGLSFKSFENVTIKRSDAKITKFEDPSFLIVPRYKGYKIYDQSSVRKFEFVSNNFIWEKQIKDKVFISQLLNFLLK